MENFGNSSKVIFRCFMIFKNFRKIIGSVRKSSAIFSLVKIWKISYAGPGYTVIWVLWVVYFPVKHCCPYNKDKCCSSELYVPYSSAANLLNKVFFSDNLFTNRFKWWRCLPARLIYEPTKSGEKWGGGGGGGSGGMVGIDCVSKFRKSYLSIQPKVAPKLL